MIRVSLFGGLGNQMFQYAAGKAVANRHGVELSLDLSGFRADHLRSFVLNSLRVPETAPDPSPAPGTGYFFRARRRQRIERVLGLVGLPKLPSFSGGYLEPHFHYDPVFATLGPNTELFGYFQSERYFAAIADEIQKYFQPREPLGSIASEVAREISDSALPISVHVRRGDYLQSATAAVHGVLDKEYYRKALAEMDGRLGGNSRLFVFSDDLDAAARVLGFVPEQRVTFVRSDPGRPWEDMILISKCRHHVIANSSFSWWGAWLNRSPDKIVVAPHAWFTERGLQTRDTRDLYPAGWIQL
jgi:hypothetical protein